MREAVRESMTRMTAGGDGRACSLRPGRLLVLMSSVDQERSKRRHRPSVSRGEPASSAGHPDQDATPGLACSGSTG